MKEFRYTALASDGATVNGSRMAADGDSLARELLEQKLVLLKSRPTLRFGTLSWKSGGRVGPREVIEFTQHMATCLSAGIPMISALADYEEQCGVAMATVIRDVRGNVNSGASLDEALAGHPETFGPVYLAMSRVGGKAGGMDRIFTELVDYLEWSEGLRAQLRQAMVYPVMLLSAIGGLFLLLMLFVIPRFSATFAGVDMDLPTLTLQVMAMGEFMGRWWWLVLGSLAAALFSLKFALGTERGRHEWDRLLLRLPVVGKFIRKIAFSRFSRTFSLMFASGLDLIRLLELLEGVVGNAVISRRLRRIRLRVVTGESLTTAFTDAGVFPSLVLRLISVGESTGTLDSSLLKAAEAYDKEIPRDLDKAIAIFQAIVIAVLGILVCLAALSLLMPIMQIRGTVH